MGGSKLDWTSLALVIDEPYHECTLDLWANPGNYPWMREALHETYHYWQVLTVPLFLRVVLERYTNFYRTWAALHQGSESVDLPTPAYDSFVAIEQEYGFSTYNLIEGLTRYWDLHSAGAHILLKAELGDEEYAKADAEFGPFERFVPGYEKPGYSYKAYNYVMLKGDSYSRAYRFLFERMENLGPLREGFVGILFPYMAFAGLQTERPVATFAHLAEQASNFFEIAAEIVPPGTPDIESIWRGLMIPFEEWAKENIKEFSIELLSPEFVYYDQQAAWDEEKIQYPYNGETRQLKTHPTLELVFKSITPIGPYIVPPGSPLLQFALSSEPQDEGWHLAHFSPDFVPRLFKLPGVTIHREFLFANFSPPVTAFQITSPGKTAFWGPFFVMGDDEEHHLFTKLVNETLSLLMLSRAAFALGVADANDLETNACPHFNCDWWDWRICGGVISYPEEDSTCYAKTIIHSSLSFGNAIVAHPNYQAAQDWLLEDEYERVKGKLLAEEII